MSLLPPVGNQSHINSICIGSGRFLRSVLVPALLENGLKPIIVQTRGRTFMDYLGRTSVKYSDDLKMIPYWEYEVDTVEWDGTITTQHIPCYGAGTLGTSKEKEEIMNLLNNISDQIRIIGIGVTEAGLVSCNTEAMKDLYGILSCIHLHTSITKNSILSVINTDNLPQNGQVISKFMIQLAEDAKDEGMTSFLKERVVFHDTMVDRITSQRDGSQGMIPRAEPTPFKALVIQDLNQVVPFRDRVKNEQCGLVLRLLEGQLDADIALKLRIANGTHTAIAHVMALNAILSTDELSKDSKSTKLLMAYLESFVRDQILPAVECSSSFQGDVHEATVVWEDWRKRLCHPHFGLSTFFITQNGAAKGGIRIGPTVKDLLHTGKVSDCVHDLSIRILLFY